MISRKKPSASDSAMMHPGTPSRLLQKGILAPSADNSQPWKFKVLQDGSVIDLFLDKDRLSNFCDVGLLAPYISAGAVIENMTVAAAQERCRIRAEYFPDKRDPFWVARLHLSEEGHGRPHPHGRVLEQRQTNRKFYEKGFRISPEKFRELNAVVEPEGPCQLFWMEQGGPHYQALAEIIGDADQLRFEIERLHRELFAMIRFDASEAERTRDGLDFRTMEAGPGGQTIFKTIASWKRLTILNRLGFSRLFNGYARRQILTSSAVGVLVSKTKQPADYVRGGEIMERLWHEMTVQSLALQPMEGLPIFLSDLEWTGGKDLTEPQRRKLRELEARFYEISGVAREHAVILLFRAGRAAPAGMRSVRRSLESFMTGA